MMTPSAFVLAGQLLFAAPPVNVDLGKVGSVSLPVSCAQDSQASFERGLALLHSFFYEEARLTFLALREKDPTCAMASWGVAMTYYHPIWSPPIPEDRVQGAEASARAVKLGAKTALEQGLIAAMDAYWRTPAASTRGDGGTSAGVPSCHGGAPAPAGGAAAFSRALAQLWAKQPGNVEVGSFYALSLLGTAPKQDRTLAQQRQAAAILEKLWPTHRDHPGVVHYLIHAYDYPETAKLGLPAARAYAAIAPAVPHAIHMPSHIFVRLGMWDDDETSNLRSLEAAEKWMAVRHPGAAFSDDLHAADYLIYGYLQQGKDALADAQIARMAAIKEVYPAHELAAAAARAFAPLRGVLERGRWEEAAHLKIEPITAFENYPFVTGLVTYGNGLGAARLGRVAAAQRAADELERLSRTCPDSGPLGYWGGLLHSYREAVLGWVAHAQGRDDDAAKHLSTAADIEDAQGPHPVMPGPLLPAREQLGELLLTAKHPKESHAAFARSLELYPGRKRSLRGMQGLVP